ncbi:hypothetical protein BH10PLA2_BH10PLA2_33060 [soil metagenome]
MTRLHFRLAALLPLIAMVLMMTCTVRRAPVPIAFNAVGPINPKTNKAVVAANDLVRSKWVATLEDGCKPGIGYELLVDDQSVSGGKFHLLGPNKPHDLAGAGQSVPFENIRQAGKEIMFSITLTTGQGKHHDTMTIIFDEALVGEVGQEVGAKVHSGPADHQSQQLTFRRVQ